MSSNDLKIKRVLIANRGEIAVRIIRSLRELGIESIAVYSDADIDSLHVSMADYAVRLPGIAAADTYLNIDLLLAAMKASKADAVHPGYGFLSESAVFNEAVTKTGVKFIGPTVDSMNLMGNKIKARQTMIDCKIPIVPGLERPLKSAEDLKSAIEKIGYPVILKAAQGGGGRGMRVVRKPEEIEDSFNACQREALAYFGDDNVFCERFIENPRHIEVQVLFDEHGNGVYLFERDCSVQRRHQKLFEEAPSAYLNEAQRKRIGEIAVRAAAASHYCGAGTVEFICDSPDEVFFMEMNTRIQVEHPVTELITGLDLIAEQVKAACSIPLSFKQEDIKLHGWSMEARINAEDPAAGFLPAPGKINHLRLPMGPYVRVETHLYEGYEIPSAYDSMIAKIIVWGRDRNEAMNRMKRALGDMEIGGVPTTVKFHEALLENESFTSGDFTTKLIVDEWDYFTKAMKKYGSLSEDEAAIITAMMTVEKTFGKTVYSKTPAKSLWLETSQLESIRNF